LYAYSNNIHPAKGFCEYLSASGGGEDEDDGGDHSRASEVAYSIRKPSQDVKNNMFMCGKNI
jgi:hypothetical protein